jgi:hypothetical protein
VDPEKAKGDVFNPERSVVLYSFPAPLRFADFLTEDFFFAAFVNDFLAALFGLFLVTAFFSAAAFLAGDLVSAPAGSKAPPFSYPEQQSTSEPMMPDSLSPDLLQKMHAYWRAANYISVGQIYLQDNPLLESPLRLEHIKPRLLGHWGALGHDTGIELSLCPS